MVENLIKCQRCSELKGKSEFLGASGNYVGQCDNCRAVVGIARDKLSRMRIGVSVVRVDPGLKSALSKREWMILDNHVVDVNTGEFMANRVIGLSSGRTVRHKNGDTLDNRRYNLTEL